MKKINYVLIMLIILSSCSSTKKVENLYGKCSVPMYGCTQLLLNKNKTFEYYVFEDVGGENIIKGVWEKQKGDTIKLNSYEQPEKGDSFTEIDQRYITNVLIIQKKSKVVFLKKQNRKEFNLKHNQLKNKMWK
jgi:hypothetical protein